MSRATEVDVDDSVPLRALRNSRRVTGEVKLHEQRRERTGWMTDRLNDHPDNLKGLPTSSVS